jgi:hypothetical protein
MGVWRKLQKKMQWAQEKRAQYVIGKLNNDDNRVAAFKEVQLQQRKAIAAIQKQAREEENMLKAMLQRAEGDFLYRPEGVGVDFDKIEKHVQVRASKLLKTSDCLATPELEVPVPRSRPSSAVPESPNTTHKKIRIHMRPSSAPPGGPALSEPSHMPPRPATAISRSTRPGTANSRSRLKGMPEDGIPDDISEISGDEDAETLRMAHLEKLRIEQGKNLYHIVREEQELEKERLRMLAAVQPNKVGHLNRYCQNVEINVTLHHDLILLLLFPLVAHLLKHANARLLRFLIQS